MVGFYAPGIERQHTLLFCAWKTVFLNFNAKMSKLVTHKIQVFILLFYKSINLQNPLPPWPLLPSRLRCHSASSSTAQHSGGTSSHCQGYFGVICGETCVLSLVSQQVAMTFPEFWDGDLLCCVVSGYFLDGCCSVHCQLQGKQAYTVVFDGQTIERIPM